MDPDEGCRGAGDKNPNLIKKIVKRVEFSVGRKRRVVRRGRGDGKVKGRGDALIDSIFGNIDEEKWKHVGKEEGAGSLQVLLKE